MKGKKYERNQAQSMGQFSSSMNSVWCLFKIRQILISNLFNSFLDTLMIN